VRVLVTGGAGYIGSTLIPRLLAQGHQVTVFDSLEHGDDSLRACSQSPGFTLRWGDVRDAALLRWAAAGCGAIVHLAALSGYPACARDPQQASEVNVLGTANAVSAAAGDMPVVLASTLSCYGAVPEGLCDENTHARPVSHYGKTKREAEDLVLSSPRGIVLRLATAFGPSPRLRLDLLVNSFVHTLARGETLEVYEPEARRSFVHVSDAARAFLFALEKTPHLAGRAFNVGDESLNLSKRELAERIRRHLPASRVSYAAAGHDADRRDYAVSFARIRREGFRTEASLEQGIEELTRLFS
jgi:nucleoside-diphosphate-sugar epimerase